ncbi:efflux transporter, outer membrane factor (OMF) lipoprotein, NodT family [Cyclobacterium lianum]|uniref:Efflux transporter, outer membrane factor (OMF) lipoprotein, NodT family n=1 Tax=Cyclobacterium lianum TaxID=388280 RepID=A0A1M7QRM1_9BACT|nr:efflux transporter outer membrane subunit [Cyclobacterium lianum]SHN34246.1 efflux transporter, outer membrane factor (OMF) lipoprotein, NodT family [Cyclobacterium lianum]
MSDFMNTTPIKYILLFVFLGLYSCKVQQDTPVSSLEPPQSYPETAAAADSASMALTHWEAFFRDPLLQQLIKKGLENNQDVAKTLAQVRIARANLSRAKMGQLPEINLQTGAAVTKFGDYTMDGVGNDDTNRSPTVPEDKRIPVPYKDFMIGAAFSWELDIWGKLSMQKKQALADYLAAEEMTHLAQTWLVAEIANHYYKIVGLDEEIETLLSNIAFQEQAFELGKSLKNAGQESQLSIDQFEALMLNSKGLLVRKRRELRQTELNLAYLLGTYPENISRQSLSEIDVLPEVLEIGLPADLLRMRPDIRAAEQSLQANNLEVSIARTAFFPTLNLYGMAGFNAFDFSKLFLNPASMAYQLGGGLIGPLFNRNRIKAAYQEAKSRQKIALYDYEQTVLDSYLEVLTLVNDYSTLDEELALKTDEVLVQRRSVDNANTMFKVGYADYLDVINSQSNALSSELDYIELKIQQLESITNLYRALGGGWQQQ